MSGAFERSREVEKEGWEQLLPILRRYVTSGSLLFMDHKRETIEFQKYGDAMGQDKAAKTILRFELKTETADLYGNMFLETWSNRTKFRPGWLVTSEADLLIYQFLKEEKAYVIDMQSLKRWAFGEGEMFGKIYAHKERKQKKVIQDNDTWGFCVPIGVLRKEVGFREELDLSDPNAGTSLFGLAQ